MGLGILAILFGGGLTVLFARGLFTRTIPALRASRNGAVAHGRVLRIRTHHTETNGIRSFVRDADIEFTTADGGRVKYIQILETGLECHTGEAVTVHYDPRKPDKSATIKDPYDVMTNLMVNSGLTVLFGLMFVFGVLLVLGVVKGN